MATPLDLQEQEQLDQLKAFWKRWGNLISALAFVVLGGAAAWNGWTWWQVRQSARASLLYDDIDRAALANDAERAGRIAQDLRENFGGTVFAAQGNLLAARVQAGKDQTEAAATTLRWVAEQGADAEYRSLARLRLAGLLLDLGRHDEALAGLKGLEGGVFEGLAADRRGDILKAQGKAAEAIAAFQQAHAALEAGSDYQRVVEAKLLALGVQPAALAAGAGGKP